MNTTNKTKQVVVADNGKLMIQPGMLSTERAKKYIDDDMWKVYRRTGGKLTKNQYRYVAATFIKMTIDIYVGGDPKFFESREEACGYFQIWMNLNGYKETPNRIFLSIDTVHAYT